MGVDFHWISTTISRGGSHNGFGTIVSFPSVPASYPEAGTILQTLTYEPIPVAQGGSSVTIGGTLYLTQTCSVYRKANGSGGDYLDWANKFDVYYLSWDSYLASVNGSYQIDINGTLYPNGGYEDQYFNDGNGGAYLGNTITNYPSGGTSLGTGSGDYYVSINSTNYQAGTYSDNYLADGYGGYTTDRTYTYYGYATLIVAFDYYTNVAGNDYANGMQNGWYSDGNGGTYNSDLGSYYSYGTFIYNDGSYTYYWNGNGGYYS